MSAFPVGNTVNLRAEFRIAGVLVDPDTVTSEIRPPNAAPYMITPTKLSTGVYSSTLTPEVVGAWHYRFVGSGAAIASRVGAFAIYGDGF